MKKLEFDLIEWREAYKNLPKNITSLQMRNLKKKYFKGNAFNTAFPLALIEMPQRWVLDGVVEIEDGSEYEFEWRPDGILTFTDLIKKVRLLGRSRWKKLLMLSLLFQFDVWRVSYDTLTPMRKIK